MVSSNRKLKDATPTQRRRASRRVQNLLKQMSVLDKIGQMSQIDLALLLEDDPNQPGMKRVSEDKIRHYFGELGIGSVLNTVIGQPWAAQDYRQVQILINQAAANYSRPPVLWGIDSVHGANYIHGAVLSPQPINIAASFNVTVSYQAGQWASRDSRAAGMQWIFSPLLGLALEPKWSRVYETFGEDPVLVAEMASNMIRGIQEPEEAASSDSDQSDVVVVPSKAAACAKHYIGYSVPRNGHDRSPSWIPTRHLFQYFVPPWRRVLQPSSTTTTTTASNAGDSTRHTNYDLAMTVMESYTEMDGVPNVANRFTLDYLLRQRLRFDGVLVTDFEEIYNLHQWHHVVASHLEAVVYALQQGTVDMSMIPFDDAGFRQAITTALDQNQLDQERLDRSVQRVLQLKEDLDMFDQEITMDNNPHLHTMNSTTRIQQGLEMAAQSIVLTKNSNGALPMATLSERKIFITGPTAHSLAYQSGGWTWQWQGAPPPFQNRTSWFTYGTTVYQALASTVKPSEKGTGGKLVYSCGVDVRGGECQDVGDLTSPSLVEQLKDWIGLGEPDTSIQRAVDRAKGSDVVIVCVGEEAYAEKPGDIRSMYLPQGQQDLVRALKKAGHKLVLVYFGGRPRLLGDMVDNADAVLIGFLPGPSAGQAVVDIISGKTNPSGRLPVTYPKFEDGGGLPYFHTISDQCTQGEGDEPMPHYKYLPCEMQWPFGHGLSYTSFTYSGLTLSSKSVTYAPTVRRHLQKNEKFRASVTVKNTGTMPGAEVVFFFSFDESRQTTPEYKRLRSFQKIHLNVGEEATVHMDLSADDLKYIGPHDDTHLKIEDGQNFRVGVGAATDCRVDPTTQPLCSEPITIHAGSSYRGACDIACEIWANSGCDAFFSSVSCWDLCTSMEGDEGWGWNYVGCIESVAWGFQQQQQQPSDALCPKLTTLCRNVFTTGNLDRFGQGAATLTGFSTQPQAMTAVWVATACGILSSTVMLFAIMGGFQKRRVRANLSGEEGDNIQFTSIENQILE